MAQVTGSLDYDVLNEGFEYPVDVVFPTQEEVEVMEKNIALNEGTAPDFETAQ